MCYSTPAIQVCQTLRACVKCVHHEDYSNEQGRALKSHVLCALTTVNQPLTPSIKYDFVWLLHIGLFVALHEMWPPGGCEIPPLWQHMLQREGD